MPDVVIFTINPSDDYPDGGVSVTRPGYDDPLRPADDTDAALLERVIERSVLGRVDSNGDGVCKDGIYHIVPDSDIPQDRTFREAWVCSNGSIKTDMIKARAIHMDRIRAARDEKLAALDVPWMKAVEAGDSAAQAAIVGQKKQLRDIPQTLDLTEARTAGALQAIWPETLA